MAKSLVFVALLRGINVAGKNMIKMTDLKQSFESLGFSDVKTYLQSGNVIFKVSGAGAKADVITKKIQALLKKDYKADIPVVVRSDLEIQSIASENPYLKMKKIDLEKLHTVFLSESAPKDGIKKLKEISSGKDTLIESDREIYLHCPDGYGNTKLSNAAIERACKITATTRNWKTTLALVEMLLTGP